VKDRSGHRGISAARAQYAAWPALARAARWQTQAAIKSSHPKTSILKSRHVVFNIEANDFRLIALVHDRCRGV
jgi:mRNA interferase HigB